jgi:hypothetical protein
MTSVPKQGRLFEKAIYPRQNGEAPIDAVAQQQIQGLASHDEEQYRFLILVHSLSRLQDRLSAAVDTFAVGVRQ